MTMLDYKGMLGKLVSDYGGVDCLDLSNRQLGQLRDGLKAVTPAEITSANDGKQYIQLLRKYREAVAENDKLHGDNYPKLLNSLLSVGEDGLYSDPLRFIFELIQNVDDCEYQSTDDCKLDMWFDFNGGKIVLTYNETGFTPFNVFAVTGIAERVKNISASKNEIGEKGIGFKSVFGVAECVLIRSGWFSFELHRDNFTIPIASYSTDSWCEGTEMTLYVQGRIQEIYRRIKAQYCNKDALFSRNPLLFLNKLTSLKMYFDRFRGMEFRVSRPKEKAWVERDIVISADLRDHDIERGIDLNEKMRILCTRYTYPATYSPEACRARYGEKTEIGRNGGKKMLLQVVMPNAEHLGSIGTGSLYSFLPTQLKLTVPVVCHVPFKLDASREFVDPQKNDLWFRESVKYLSSLMDYAYSDWCQEVKETIVRYLPSKRESLFAPNNGKEKCLSELVCFRGEHFLELPLFLTTDHTFKTAQEIFSFAQDEDIIDPETVCRLMEYRKALFIPPAAVQCSNFGIEIERNANLQLFETALKKEAITAEALDYLDQVEFQCSETLVSQQGRLELSPGQIQALMRYDRFAEPFQKMACQRIRQNRRPEFSIIGVPLQRITDVLDDGFELGETPEKAENCFKYCGEACVCLDIGEKGFLPCKNGVVLSSKNILSSFAAFCSAIDDKDTFAIRVRLREASARLDRCVEDSSGSAEDYLRQLKNIRLSVKDSLGRSYKGYISRILEAGTNKGRFVQELLQNADDCQYPKGTKPAFRLKPRDSSVVIEYNEIGFTRSDIRAITAIGESTKNKMLSGSAGAIGEKGVGFKMVFGVASEVKISSGEYHFLLTDREPTIPKRLETQPAKTDGTRMELILKEREDVPYFSEKSILELCLCLRKLKELEFEVHKVSICDTEDSRVITIDKKRHVFKRFVHSFTIEDEAALNERRDETREVSTQQQIICYVPEGNKSAEYYLYAGLPIQHRFNVPLVIDAPFILTTSREQIKTAASPWNDCVRRELYEAIQGVIDALKGEQRASVFQYMRFLPRRQGMLQIYVNAISDCDYLNAYPFREVLRSCEILPTFDREVFARPAEGTARRYSDATNALCSLLSPSDFSNTDLSAIIDVPGKDYEAILNALGCMPADFGTEFDLLSNYVEHFIGNEEFRPKLYEFLMGRPEAYCERIRKYAIIPVLGKTNDSVNYVPWKDDSIFVKPGASVSDHDYHILNEQFLPKSDCEKY